MPISQFRIRNFVMRPEGEAERRARRHNLIRPRRLIPITEDGIVLGRVFVRRRCEAPHSRDSPLLAWYTATVATERPFLTRHGSINLLPRGKNYTRKIMNMSFRTGTRVLCYTAIRGRGTVTVHSFKNRLSLRPLQEKRLIWCDWTNDRGRKRGKTCAEGAGKWRGGGGGLEASVQEL